jgi:hypothetical protein
LRRDIQSPGNQSSVTSASLLRGGDATTGSAAMSMKVAAGTAGAGPMLLAAGSAMITCIFGGGVLRENAAIPATAAAAIPSESPSATNIVELRVN